MVYPLSPLAFVAVLSAVGYCTLALVGGRPLALTFSPRTWKWILVIAGVALSINWASKLIWLGIDRVTASPKQGLRVGGDLAKPFALRGG